MSFNADLLGFLVTRIDESHFLQEMHLFQHMARVADLAHLQVCVLSLLSIDWTKQTIQGLFYVPEKQIWEQRESPFPRVIFDRTFITSVRERDLHRQCVHRFQQQGILIAGYGLKGKWAVYTALKSDPIVDTILPETLPLAHIRRLGSFLAKRQHAFLKPQSSSKGRGAIQIIQQANRRYTINARDRKNRLIMLADVDAAFMFRLIDRLTEGKKYLLQPNLELVSADGHAFDIRVLMQKNASGSWSLTGTAVRKGQPGSATSNLHGGGDAMETMPFLTHEFGANLAIQLYEQMLETAETIPKIIEVAFGRFYELGIDYGIDRLGRLWLLEVNSKPGKTVFTKLGDHRKRSMSLYKPLMYARYLLNGRPRIGHALQTFRRVT